MGLLMMGLSGHLSMVPPAAQAGVEVSSVCWKVVLR